MYAAKSSEKDYGTHEVNDTKTHSEKPGIELQTMYIIGTCCRIESLSRPKSQSIHAPPHLQSRGLPNVIAQTNVMCNLE